MTTKPKRVGRRQALDFLRRQITQLALPPGTAVSEAEIGKVLGVSRTPVREALLLLAEEGLVEVLPKVGTFITRVDPDRVAEAQFLREAVELASLKSLKYPLDEDLVGELEDNVQRQFRSTESYDEFIVLDEEFHRGLMGLAGHEDSWAAVASAKSHLDRARRLGIQQRSVISLVKEHEAVLHAVLREDLEIAETLLRQHVRVIFKDIQELAAQRPELFVTDPDARPVRKSVIVWE